MRGKQDFVMNRIQFHLKMCCLPIINDGSEHRIHELDDVLIVAYCKHTVKVEAVNSDTL